MFYFHFNCHEYYPLTLYVNLWPFFSFLMNLCRLRPLIKTKNWLLFGGGGTNMGHMATRKPIWFLLGWGCQVISRPAAQYLPHIADGQGKISAGLIAPKFTCLWVLSLVGGAWMRWDCVWLILPCQSHNQE